MKLEKQCSQLTFDIWIKTVLHDQTERRLLLRMYTGLWTEFENSPYIQLRNNLKWQFTQANGQDWYRGLKQK